MLVVIYRDCRISRVVDTLLLFGGMRKNLTELEETMAETGGQVTDYYDALIRRLIEQITVHDDKYMVELKSGIEIDVRL